MTTPFTSTRAFASLHVVLLCGALLSGCGSGEGSPSLSSSTGGSGGVFTSAGGAPPASGGAAPASGGTPMFTDPTEMNGGGCGDDDVDILFVVDRSGSMNCNLPAITPSSDCEATPERAAAAEPSKWEIIVSSLSAAFGKLVSDDPARKIRAGLSYFSADDRCGVRSQPTVPVLEASTAQIDLLKQSLSQQQPAGGTPIVGATILAYHHLYEELAIAGEGHVIVLTDGADSCDADYDVTVGPSDHIADLIGAEAPKALGVGIKTWIIGAPGSEPARGMLSKLAVAGGTRRSPDCNPGDPGNPATGDCHYDMTTGDFEQALATALDEILAVVTCEVR